MSGALGVHICTERGKLCQSQHVTTLRHTSDRTETHTHTHTRAVVHATRDFQILLEWNGRSLAKSSLANKIQNLIAGTSSQKQAALWKPRVNRARWKGTYKEHPPPANFNSTLSSSLKRYNWKRAFFYRWHLWTVQIQGLTYVLHV